MAKLINTDRKADALALAHILYDIYKENLANDTMEDESDIKNKVEE